MYAQSKRLTEPVLPQDSSSSTTPIDCKLVGEITEYAPTKIKMAITGKGSAGKEQVADMLRRMLNLDKEEMPHFLDATDALGAAYCHYLQMGRPDMGKGPSSWKEFVSKNPGRVSGKK